MSAPPGPAPHGAALRGSTSEARAASSLRGRPAVVDAAHAERQLQGRANERALSGKIGAVQGHFRRGEIRGDRPSHPASVEASEPLLREPLVGVREGRLTKTVAGLRGRPAGEMQGREPGLGLELRPELSNGPGVARRHGDSSFGQPHRILEEPR